MQVNLYDIIKDMEHHTKKDEKLSTPMAIIIAGALIMWGIFFTKNNDGVISTDKNKTPSEQLGINKTELEDCIINLDTEKLGTDIFESVKKAMSGLGENERGTPYSIVIGKNGVKTDIRGALAYEDVKKTIDNAMIGKVEVPYKGNVEITEPNDHIQGNPNAEVTIIEYSDFECPYCKKFQSTMDQVMKEYKGNVKWIYRNFPLHQHSFEKLVAAECVADIKGEDAYFKYANALFGMLKTADDSVSDQL